jgi:Holliday junction resolvase
MPNNNYKRGYRFENDFVNKLKAVGFPLVIRTAGSHSCVDVVAFGYNDVYLFQLKSTEKTVITNELVQAVMKNKSVKDLTNLPSRYIKVLAFKAEGKKDIVFYRWNNDGWKYIQNKIF